jgi:hypothetical protein
MEADKVVYFHRKATNGEIFYVGMGCPTRPYYKRRTDWWQKVVNKYGYTIDIVHKGLTKQEAFELEIKYIAQFGRCDLKTGGLVNQTSGGPSFNGITKEKTKNRGKTLKGRAKSKQHRERISTSLSNLAKSEIHKSKISSAMKGRKLSQETKDRISKNSAAYLKSKPVACYNYYTKELIANFSSHAQAARVIGCNESLIYRNLNKILSRVYSKSLKKYVKFNLICNPLENILS